MPLESSRLFSLTSRNRSSNKSELLNSLPKSQLFQLSITKDKSSGGYSAPGIFFSGRVGSGGINTGCLPLLARVAPYQSRMLFLGSIPRFLSVAYRQNITGPSADIYSSTQTLLLKVNIRLFVAIMPSCERKEVLLIAMYFIRYASTT